MSTDESIHVLCLHGCCQDAAMFESILTDYIKIGGKSHKLVFHFLEGAYEDPLRGKTWYSRPLDVAAIGTIAFDKDLVASAMAQLDKAIDETGATVLLGFSQGGNVIDTYLHHYGGTSKIERAVLCSTYPLVSWTASSAAVYDQRPPLDLPVLSVYSSIGDDITPAAFQPMAYTPLRTMTHTKGHKMVTSKPVIREMCVFMAGAFRGDEKK